MKDEQLTFDVIIIGGSFAGLSAAMALGRSRRKVLVMDGGKPCNRQTPHAHNLVAHDGDTPASIAAKAKEQVLLYPSVQFIEGDVIGAGGTNGAFGVTLDGGAVYNSRKLLLATGVHDIHPQIPGFAECWGISVLHCPYCHGYEVRDEALGVLARGDMAFEFARLISHWSPSLTLFTNGPAGLAEEQLWGLEQHHIRVEEKVIDHISHRDGQLTSLIFSDGSTQPLKALFSKSNGEQPGTLVTQLGCELHEEGMFGGLIVTNDMGKTNVAGVYAAGDNCNPMRSLAIAIASGGKAGAAINHELILEDF